MQMDMFDILEQQPTVFSVPPAPIEKGMRVKLLNEAVQADFDACIYLEGYHPYMFNGGIGEVVEAKERCITVRYKSELVMIAAEHLEVVG